MLLFHHLNFVTVIVFIDGRMAAAFLALEVSGLDTRSPVERAAASCGPSKVLLDDDLAVLEGFDVGASVVEGDRV